MPKKTEYDIERLRVTEARRQTILDFLHANPGANSKRVILHISGREDDRSMSATICNMLRDGELAASGGRHERAYYAVATTTRSAESCQAARIAACRSKAQRVRAAKAEAPTPPPKKKNEPWRTVYHSGDNPDIAKSQRGQGAIRPKVTVNCYQNY
jgi:hypothetical protein